MNLQVLCPEGHSVLIHPTRLGGDVTCPHCFTRFVSCNVFDPRRQAVPEKGKARPARDDDDDEDDERPQRKAKAAPPKKKKDEKDAKSKKTPDKELPKVKKPLRKKRDEEEEDDDEDEDEDDEDEEEDEAEEEVIEIEWTPRKRQLNVVRNALVSYVTAVWTIVGATLLAASLVVINLVGQFGIKMVDVVSWGEAALVIGMLSLVGIAYIAFLVGWIMCFWAPGKALMRTNLILAIIFFATPACLLGLMEILANNNAFRTDDIKNSFRQLVGAACAISLFVSLFYGLVALSKLCLFMGDKKLSTQPVTLGFGVIGFTVLIGALIYVHGFLLKAFVESKGNDIYNYLAYGVVAITFVALFFLLRTLHGLVATCQLLRKMIWNYIETQ